MPTCKHCEKPAVVHITNLVGPEGHSVVHVCEKCFKQYSTGELSEEKKKKMNEALATHIKMSEFAKSLVAAEEMVSPVSGLSLAELQQTGTLSCAHDYDFFSEQIKPLLEHVHGGATVHRGKRPSHGISQSLQLELFKTHRALRDAVAAEDYEAAAKLRDRIQENECLHRNR